MTGRQQQAADPGQAGGQDPGSDGLGIDQLAVLLRVPAGELRRARELGLLPGTDSAGRWTRQDADGIAASWPQTAAVLADTREVGASRAAELLTRQTGLTVTPAHITQIATMGLLTSSRSYRRHSLYRISDLHALIADPLAQAQLTSIVTAPAPARRICR